MSFHCFTSSCNLTECTNVYILWSRSMIIVDMYACSYVYSCVYVSMYVYLFVCIYTYLYLYMCMNISNSYLTCQNLLFILYGCNNLCMCVLMCMYVRPHHCTRVVFDGFMILIIASHPVFRPVTPQHHRRITQCPGLMIQCPGLIIQCPGMFTSRLNAVKMRVEMTPSCRLVMCACARHLKTLTVQFGIIRHYSLSVITVSQCPGIT